MELKTLKDIGRDMRMTSAIPGFARDELRDEIKQEAINWVKYYREEHGDNLPAVGFSPDTEFMKFFNITEEDL
ncbi:MAG: hypothetical protein KAR20_28365 [Candidatus Heimdallarchaeota archaeon]|nr:hypothetical protein [Candidatus Heimdallarchaeota archaeon]